MISSLSVVSGHFYILMQNKAALQCHTFVDLNTNYRKYSASLSNACAVSFFLHSDVDHTMNLCELLAVQ